jgi:hypothetical protein
MYSVIKCLQGSMGGAQSSQSKPLLKWTGGPEQSYARAVQRRVMGGFKGPSKPPALKNLIVRGQTTQEYRPGDALCGGTKACSGVGEVLGTHRNVMVVQYRNEHSRSVAQHGLKEHGVNADAGEALRLRIPSYAIRDEILPTAFVRRAEAPALDKYDAMIMEVYDVVRPFQGVRPSSRKGAKVENVMEMLRGRDLQKNSRGVYVRRPRHTVVARRGDIRRVMDVVRHLGELQTMVRPNEHRRNKQNI